MRTVLPAALAALLAASSAHASAGPPAGRYFELVNATHDSVVAFAVAPSGGHDYRDIELGAPLRGGNASTTLHLAGGDCLRDFRVAFRDGRTLVYRDIDVCRHDRLRMTPRDRRQTSAASG